MQKGFAFPRCERVRFSQTQKGSQSLAVHTEGAGKQKILILACPKGTFPGASF